jgi:hypothetical protein
MTLINDVKKLLKEKCASGITITNAETAYINILTYPTRQCPNLGPYWINWLNIVGTELATRASYLNGLNIHADYSPVWPKLDRTEKAKGKEIIEIPLVRIFHTIGTYDTEEGPRNVRIFKDYEQYSRIKELTEKHERLSRQITETIEINLYPNEKYLNALKEIEELRKKDFQPERYKRQKDLEESIGLVYDTLLLHSPALAK